VTAPPTTGPVADDFLRLADPYRRELLAHCYRMLGSVHDAEDLVQETYLRAWRGYDRFEGRSSLRTWLHKIATTACLTALESRKRRPMPTGLGGPTDDPTGELAAQPEIPWLEPVPDTLAGMDESDPANVVTGRETVRLALIAALQHLPPRQRAVLILRDVLRWQASEVASSLDMTTAAVNSALQRAHAQLDKVSPKPDEVAEPTESRGRELLARWVSVFQDYNFNGIVDLVTQDVVWEMPPFPEWVVGPEPVRQLITAQCPAHGPGDLLLVPTTANGGQPAFATYLLDPETGVHRAFQFQVLTLTPAGVSQVAIFFDTTLFAAFGFPMTANPVDTVVSED
jgi:RNA polymerase sigma-70 factor (ECF subfamily)